jgi:hypothetical protein
MQTEVAALDAALRRLEFRVLAPLPPIFPTLDYTVVVTITCNGMALSPVCKKRMDGVCIVDICLTV